MKTLEQRVALLEQQSLQQTKLIEGLTNLNAELTKTTIDQSKIIRSTMSMLGEMIQVVRGIQHTQLAYGKVTYHFPDLDTTTRH